MKCLINISDDPARSGVVIRTNEHVTTRLIATGEWYYTDKAAWKAYERSKHARNLDDSE